MTTTPDEPRSEASPTSEGQPTRPDVDPSAPGEQVTEELPGTTSAPEEEEA